MWSKVVLLCFVLGFFLCLKNLKTECLEWREKKESQWFKIRFKMCIYSDNFVLVRSLLHYDQILICSLIKQLKRCDRDNYTITSRCQTTSLFGCRTLVCCTQDGADVCNGILPGSLIWIILTTNSLQTCISIFTWCLYWCFLGQPHPLRQSFAKAFLPPQGPPSRLSCWIA